MNHIQQLALDRQAMVDGLFELAVLFERARKATNRRRYKRQAARLTKLAYVKGY